MDNTTYYQRNRDVALNKAKECYKNNNKRLKEQARNNYRNLSEEDKNKKRKYGKNRNHKMSEGKKQELREYQKQICTMKSNIYVLYNRYVLFTSILLNPYI